jgi:hypothetical protein
MATSYQEKLKAQAQPYMDEASMSWRHSSPTPAGRRQ